MQNNCLILLWEVIWISLPLTTKYSWLTSFVPFLYHSFNEENSFCLSSWGRWCFKVGLKERKTMILCLISYSYTKSIYQANTSPRGKKVIYQPKKILMINSNLSQLKWNEIICLVIIKDYSIKYIMIWSLDLMSYHKLKWWSLTLRYHSTKELERCTVGYEG